MFMEPSCAGKSTLSKYVCQELNAINEEWVVIDFDEVKESIELLITTTNHYLKKNINVIIDTNTYQDKMEEKFEGAATIAKIIVTAPLDVLLKRDEKRTERLKRNQNRAYRCRQFVIDSFHESLTWPKDFKPDYQNHGGETVLHLYLRTLIDRRESPDNMICDTITGILAKGANPALANKDGETPLMIARMIKWDVIQKPVVELLEQAAIKFNS